MDFLLTLAGNGLIHGDFNEFNILVNINNNANDICVIDFPQMISLNHIDAEKYFTRDVNCIKTFFKRKFGLTFDDDIKFEDIKRIGYLDKELEAFGYVKDEKEKKVKEEDEEEEDIKEEKKEEDEEINTDNKKIKIKEDDFEALNDDDLDFEKEKKLNEEMNQINISQSSKKKYTKEDIKEKVKKMINKQGGNKSKMGNRFKGKKNSASKVELKHI